MTIISYAQNAEDVVLRRLFPPGHQGRYIDVGASDPLEDTVTRCFYERGWRGINVEPGEIFSQLKRHRPGDVNLNVGLSNVVGTTRFYEFPDFPGSSTCSAAEAEIHRQKRGFRCVERSIRVTTLKAVCEEHARGHIDFISIDVEGHEREVLEGGDWSRFRPVVVVVEAVQPNTTNPVHEQWEEILRKADYRFGLFDGLNRYYIRGEDAHLLSRLSAPANLFDDFISYRYVRLTAELEKHVTLATDEEPCHWHAELRAAFLASIHAPHDTCCAPVAANDVGSATAAETEATGGLADETHVAEPSANVAPARRFAAASHAAVRQIRQLAKAVVKPILVRGAHCVERHPSLKRPLLWLLNRFPAVKSRLITAATPAPPVSDDSQPQHRGGVQELDATARGIYQHLLRARDRASAGAS